MMILAVTPARVVDRAASCRRWLSRAVFVNKRWLCRPLVVVMVCLSSIFLLICVHKMCRRKIGVVERARASLSKRQWICWGCIIILNQLNSWLQRVLVVCLWYCSRLDWFVVGFWIMLHAFHESARRCHHCLKKLFSRTFGAKKSRYSVRPKISKVQPSMLNRWPSSINLVYPFIIDITSQNVPRQDPWAWNSPQTTKTEMPSLLNLKEKNKRRECSVKLNPIVVQTQTRALLFNHAF